MTLHSAIYGEIKIRWQTATLFAIRGIRFTYMTINGTVKFFNAEKGFGFIAPDEGDKDVFVHSSALREAGIADLADDQRVSFDLEDDSRGKGKKAVNVSLIEG